MTEITNNPTRAVWLLVPEVLQSEGIIDSRIPNVVLNLLRYNEADGKLVQSLCSPMQQLDVEHSRTHSTS
jgi:hypothetical protein